MYLGDEAPDERNERRASIESELWGRGCKGHWEILMTRRNSFSLLVCVPHFLDLHNSALIYLQETIPSN